MSERRSPEAQFQLANERTYLAWLRTALALVASGVAAARLLAGQTLHWAWETVGVLLIMAGVVTAALARRRWRAMDAAIREGEPLPAPGIAVMIAGVIVICGLITTALLLGTNPDTFHDRLGSFHPNSVPATGLTQHPDEHRPEGSGPPCSRSAARRGLDRYNLEGEDASPAARHAEVFASSPSASLNGPSVKPSAHPFLPYLREVKRARRGGLA